MLTVRITLLNAPVLFYQKIWVDSNSSTHTLKHKCAHTHTREWNWQNSKYLIMKLFFHVPKSKYQYYYCSCSRKWDCFMWNILWSYMSYNKLYFNHYIPTVRRCCCFFFLLQILRNSFRLCDWNIVYSLYETWEKIEMLFVSIYKSVGWPHTELLCWEKKLHFAKFQFDGPHFFL